MINHFSTKYNQGDFLDDFQDNKNFDYNKDYLYISGYSGYFYYGKVKKIKLSIITNKEKNMKTLCWKNKYNELHLFVNNYNGDLIKLVKPDEINEFKIKFHKDFINNECSKSFNSGSLCEKLSIHLENFTSYNNVCNEENDVFQNVYDIETGKINLDTRNILIKEIIFNELHNLENRYEIIKNFIKTGELTVDANNKSQVNILKKIQKAFQSVFTLKDVEKIEDVFKLCDIDFDKFIFSETEIIKDHEYIFTGEQPLEYRDSCLSNPIVNINKKFMLLDSYYTKSFKIMINDKTDSICIHSNSDYEKKMLCVDPELVKKIFYQKNYNNYQLIFDLFQNVSEKTYQCLSNKISSFIPIRFLKKEDIFPLYDEGKIELNKYYLSSNFHNSLNDKSFYDYVDIISSYLSTGYMSLLAEKLFSDKYILNILNSNNINISTIYENIYVVYFLFEGICCKEERDMLHMLDTFSDFNLFLDFLQNFLEKKGEVK